MITRIIEACARNRGMVLFAAVVLGVGSYASLRRVRLDAVPDLTDPQVIVFTEWRGRSPTLIEDQVTYPLVTALLSAPRVVDVRGQSMFGMSFIYVIFEEGTDGYWARSRVLEYLDSVRDRLPRDVAPRIGPDATGIGWVYQYALVDRSGGRDAGELRSLHDYSVRYALASVPGVAEVASVGGFEQQYQVTVDPQRLRAQGLSIQNVARAMRRSNDEVGGRVVEMSEREYFVRGRGYVRSTDDIARIVLRSNASGAAVTVGDVARVTIGGDIRRGAADLDGRGETVSGIVVMRHGENALEVIRRVRQRLDEIRRSLPPGVEIVTAYDRSALIGRAIDTLSHTLRQEMLVVAAVIVLFLLHFRSALLPIVTLPLAVGMAFIPMYLLGIPATIMSLGGIAIAIGATVDAEIVMIEAAHKHLEHAPKDISDTDRERLLAKAAREVTPAIFFSLLIVAASFIPVFGLTGQAGRLFRPLAFTKTFVMLGAAILSVTLAPALRSALLRGRIRSEDRHPVSRAIRAVYEPFVHVALRKPRTTVLIGVMALISAIPLARRLGTEFMPPLDEGDLLYMPTTFPNISIEAARAELRRQDAILRSFPEVLSVLGKVGRADSPTDPAPLSMVETVVRLRPASEWRTRYVRRWYHRRTPAWLRPLLTRIWPEFVPMTREDLVREMNDRLRRVGWTNAFTQPIRARIDMNTTGIRTPVGIKIYGTELHAIERVGEAIERVLRRVPGTRSVLLERSAGGHYIDIVPRRESLARYGLLVGDVNDAVESALGGMTLSTTVEGRRRYSVNVRYAQDYRSSIDAIRQMPLDLREAGETDSGASNGASQERPGTAAAATGRVTRTMTRQIALSEVADVRITSGPPMLRDEGGMLVSYVFVDIGPERDLGGYVAQARGEVDRAVRSGEVQLAHGMQLRWTGQYELLRQTEERMKFLVPLALLVVILLLYVQFRSTTEVAIILLSVPFALVGSIWALHLLDYRVSTAVWVGIIALVGLAAQTGVVMIVYIDNAYDRRKREGRIRSLEDIIEAHAEGTIQRVRPKLMTVATMLVGLVPLLWARGSGADVMKRIAAPMVGGLITSAFLTLEIIPVIYTYWRYEQLLWEKLEATRVLRILRTSSWAARALALAATGSLLARLYFSVPRIVTLATIGAGVACVASILLYLIARDVAVASLARTKPAVGSEQALPPTPDPSE